MKWAYTNFPSMKEQNKHFIKLFKINVFDYKDFGRIQSIWNFKD